MSRFGPEVEAVLRGAGWFPGRSVDIEPWRARFANLDIHDAALDFWREFGGLAVDISGPGITVARAPFEFDPSDCWRIPCVGDEDPDDWSLAFGRQLVPIGRVEHIFELAIDELGIVYMLETWAACCGPVDQAIEGLVLGVRPEEIPNADLPLPPLGT